MSCVSVFARAPPAYCTMLIIVKMYDPVFPRGKKAQVATLRAAAAANGRKFGDVLEDVAQHAVQVQCVCVCVTCRGRRAQKTKEVLCQSLHDQVHGVYRGAKRLARRPPLMNGCFAAVRLRAPRPGPARAPHTGGCCQPNCPPPSGNAWHTSPGLQTISAPARHERCPGSQVTDEKSLTTGTQVSRARYVTHVRSVTQLGHATATGRAHLRDKVARCASAAQVLNSLLECGCTIAAQSLDMQCWMQACGRHPRQRQ